MFPRSLVLGMVLLATLGLTGCAANPDSPYAPLASAAPSRGKDVLVRNLHATPRYRGGPPLSPIYRKRQPQD